MFFNARAAKIYALAQGMTQRKETFAVSINRILQTLGGLSYSLTLFTKLLNPITMHIAKFCLLGLLKRCQNQRLSGLEIPRECSCTHYLKIK